MISGKKVVAFIPVRGGSKSIPLKNIKPLCGKPLVCWNIEALVDCPYVDEIIVATDSDAIWNTVTAATYPKVNMYRRSAENACDTASTESVMLEYIKAASLPSDNVFMLVQATSPLTATEHFSGALQMYGEGECDSIISCVRNFRFFWTEDGKSLNYDYMNRPRRQNFSGMLMENGAFYINTVDMILSNGNRLGGKIAVYEMPEYTATEIDEPDDWVIMENLMAKYRVPHVSRSEIKLFVTDVDGTLTDGGMYYSEKGDELKKFNTRDGMGLQLLREAGIKTGIITSENTEMVARRAAKLKCDFLIQGKCNKGKLEALQEICTKENLSLSEVAYIGDDVNCVETLKAVGYAACPADACEKAKAIPGIKIMQRKGGDGCVREFVEIILGIHE